MSKSNSHVRIKICGVTRSQDAQIAVEMGVDAIGMILHAHSPRLITCQQASKIRAVVPDTVSLVGVFVDGSAEMINQLVGDVGLDIVQLHGRETDEFASQLNAPYIKAIRVKSKPQLEIDLLKHPAACALLLDPYVAGQAGGTGKVLDLKFWPNHAKQKIILAGGLNSNNVAAVLKQIIPYGIDLNSGVESRPGVKDGHLIEAAMRALGR